MCCRHQDKRLYCEGQSLAEGFCPVRRKRKGREGKTNIVFEYRTIATQHRKREHQAHVQNAEVPNVIKDDSSVVMDGDESVSTPHKADFNTSAKVNLEPPNLSRMCIWKGSSEGDQAQREAISLETSHHAKLEGERNRTVLKCHHCRSSVALKSNRTSVTYILLDAQYMRWN